MTGRASGHSTAVAHGPAQWLPTGHFVAERLTVIDQACDHVRTLAPHCRQKRAFLLLEEVLKETAAFLEQEMPSELPFLTNTHGMPQRLRIAAVMREWLLTSRHPRREGHLKAFLRGYHEISPLCFTEIELMPIALRLAVIEKCRLLPSAENATHREILPRLLQHLATTCRFITRTDWRSLAETVNDFQADRPAAIPTP